MDDSILLQWVKTHNLDNIDIEIPKNKLITITWVSWSWKSSLAFHTIYKEWQFRYIESLSSYLRQFFNLGTRPDIEHSEWLSPAIAIEQNKSIGNSRSNVGTLTEIDDYLRLLYAKVGHIYSYKTWLPIKAQTIDQIVDDIYDRHDSQKVFLLHKSIGFKKEDIFNDFVTKNRKKVEKEKWFTRYLIVSDNEEKAAVEYFYLEEPNIPEDYFPLKVYGIYDRVTVAQEKRARLKEDAIKILEKEKKFGVYVDSTANDITRYTDKNYCPQWDITYPDFQPTHFSANRAEGACEHCHGTGEVLQVDFDKIIDPDQSLLNAILPWRDSRLGQNILKKLSQKYAMKEDIRRSELPERFRDVVVNGDNELIRVGVWGKFVSLRYNGIEEILKDQYAKGMLTVDFQAMLEMRECPECQWAKLNKKSLHVFLTMDKKIAKKEKLLTKHHYHDEIIDETNPDLFLVNIAELHEYPLEKLRDFLQIYKTHTTTNSVLVERILKPLMDRVDTITKLGLGYLTIKRRVQTLSGWEIQRLRLAKQLGNKLTGIIYVLDEPTIGLDNKEIKKVIQSIRELQKMGNSIIVVEHHDEFIKASDRVVEIGPGAWDFGGKVVFNGPYKDFIKQATLTADYINGIKKIEADFTHEPTDHTIKIKKARKHNLQNIDVDIQLWSFTIITWPSWAGKTTLMYETLFRFLQEKQKFVQSFIRLQLLKQGMSRQDIISAPVMKANDYQHYENLAHQEFYKDIGVDTIMWYEHIDHVLYVDQTSIGKTPRSCPSTFIGVFDDIRKLYAWVPDAKYLGFNAGHFSFNSNKGACPECKWYGYKKVELQFLPDTYIPCELCNGQRYKPEILDIKRRDKNISEVLNMYIKDALRFFKDMDHIAQQLQLLVDIWLWYLKMGQPAHMLSWWESQRLKLVKHLLKSYRGNVLYFLDEPTVWLHPDDINRLLAVLKKFLDDGATILMIEHDPHLLGFADHVIKLNNGKLVKKR